MFDRCRNAQIGKNGQYVRPMQKYQNRKKCLYVQQIAKCQNRKSKVSCFDRSRNVKIWKNVSSFNRCWNVKSIEHYIKCSKTFKAFWGIIVRAKYWKCISEKHATYCRSLARENIQGVKYICRKSSVCFWWSSKIKTEVGATCGGILASTRNHVCSPTLNSSSDLCYLRVQHKSNNCKE